MNIICRLQEYFAIYSVITFPHKSKTAVSKKSSVSKADYRKLSFLLVLAVRNVCHIQHLCDRSILGVASCAFE